ncbi:MAG: glycoside hydrolase family 3 C-terminal domain-containing protein, partial [Prevotella sp.]
EYRHLPEAVRRGDIKEEDLDRSLRRLIIARIIVGDFDSDDRVSWTRIPENVVASARHKQLALDMARKSIVLLKNNGVLPLNAPLDRRLNAQLIVMGPNANDSVMQWGNYAGYPTKTVTALEGIRRQLGNIPYLQGCGLTRNESFESRFSQIKTPLGSQGMQAVYYNNTNMTGSPAASVTLTEPIKLSNGGNTVFAPGVNLENFSARLDGTFTPTNDETLIFSISGDDRIRLLVDGDTLVNLWQARQRIQNGQHELQVKAGHDYRIQIDYVQETGYGALNFDIQHKSAPTPQELLAQVGDAKTVIFVGGISPRLEGEEMRVSEPGFRGGDRTSIELPQAQRDVLRWLHEAGKKVVFVNCSGGAVAMVPELETCDAILQWWYDGEQGGTALADVLTGQYNPSGKLPVTFYRCTDELPDFLDYTMKNRTYRYYTGEPLFPFGHGLSYTTFEMKDLKVREAKDGSLEISVMVKNTGKADGTETVQVYFRRTADKEGPVKTLCGYQQVSLKAGESQVVTVALPRQRLETWDVQSNTMRFLPGQYLLMAGPSSADAMLLKTSVQL